ncbi:acyl-CoA dehydrogenase [Microbulbifer sp. OS29]|uniref:Acyl-CoA dehydrogenase n=1 Tax=Microbulbifer okhotskensis TaxID=2926617 RepID=A0A9X2EN22_9GAMM|nr:acyl-CoA dehydrogenase [Microbulbifer okhotskensis]MCO1334751.1 acyl-CoA dehydrogenase [Microbulbifer okhotskensis]
MGENIYKTDLSEFQFLIQEQFHESKTLLGDEVFKGCTPQIIAEVLQRAKKFAYEVLGPAYQESDRQGCRLENGRVELPDAFPSMWSRFKSDWGEMSSFNGEDDRTVLPPFVMQMVLEMFMGANPSFMTYGGFCLPSSTLVEKYGTDLQKKLFSDKLATSEWTSCLCLTEPQAGSDVSLVETRASRQEDGSYLLTGEKYLISAGMHELTENSIYFVMGRGEKSGSGTYGLSCFMVPKYWVEEDGSLGAFNNIECLSLAEKMGFKGCANTHLRFGGRGPCRAYLLGNRENVGLLQFLTLMNQARISTGVYALGMASSAYYNALAYATTRLQGKKFHESFSSTASRVNIVEHSDVQRMLLEMKSKVEGCRALVAKLTLSESLVKTYQGREEQEKASTHHQGLMNLLTPVVKAYISDQAWRVCELAIQTCGGQGYLQGLGIEQYARDIKVLAIWEGTNYIQSQDLIRDKLGLGNSSKLFQFYKVEVDNFLNRGSDYPQLSVEFSRLKTSFEHFEMALKVVYSWVKSKEMFKIPAYSTRILHMLGDITLAWLLLEAACASADRLSREPEANDRDFYKSKIISAKFFIRNELPRTKYTLDILQDNESFCEMEASSWDSLLSGTEALS